MPQVSTSAALHFTNHWIGIYDPQGNKLAPSTRMVKALQPAPIVDRRDARLLVPADPSTLAPVYQKALSERETELGRDHPRVARAAVDLGLFLLQIGNAAAAEAPLRRAVAIDQRNSDPALDADRRNLAGALEAAGKRDEAFALYREAAAGPDVKVSAQSFAKPGAARSGACGLVLPERHRGRRSTPPGRRARPSPHCCMSTRWRCGPATTTLQPNPRCGVRSPYRTRPPNPMIA